MFEHILDRYQLHNDQCNQYSTRQTRILIDVSPSKHYMQTLQQQQQQQQQHTLSCEKWRKSLTSRTMRLVSERSLKMLRIFLIATLSPVS
jgi:hypothetical protein